jgi:hypothetical protein
MPVVFDEVVGEVIPETPRPGAADEPERQTSPAQIAADMSTAIQTETRRAERRHRRLCAD